MAWKIEIVSLSKGQASLLPIIKEYKSFYHGAPLLSQNPEGYAGIPLSHLSLLWELEARVTDQNVLILL
jgi:hypothetical protein